MERMASKKNQLSLLQVARKKTWRSGGVVVESLKEKAESELSIRTQESELQRKEGIEGQTTRATVWTVTKASKAASADFTGVDDHDAKSG